MTLPAFASGGWQCRHGWGRRRYHIRMGEIELLDEPPYMVVVERQGDLAGAINVSPFKVEPRGRLLP